MLSVPGANSVTHRATLSSAESGFYDAYLLTNAVDSKYTANGHNHP
jgi:hypothetical protein